MSGAQSAGRLLLLAVIVICSSSALSQTVKIPRAKLASSEPTFHIVSIGVGRHGNDFWPQLRWTASDAKRIGGELGVGTELAKRETILLDERATRRNIMDALARLSKRVGVDDVVVLYFSGHGTLARGKDGEVEQVLVAFDTTPEDPLGSGLPHGVVHDWLENLRAKRKVAILAACHSGVGKSKLAPAMARLLSGAKGRDLDFERVSEGSLVLSAATAAEVAREDDGLQSDIYTHFLLEALTTFDRNEDGMVEALEAHDYAKMRTFRHTKGRQRPTLSAKVVGDVSIPLRGKRERRGDPILTGYDQDYAGLEVEVRGQTKGRLPLAFPLATGRNVVKLYGGGGDELLAVYELEAKEGETIALAELTRPSPYYGSLQVVSERHEDPTFAKLSGGASASSVEGTIGMRWRSLSYGLQLALPRTFSREIAPNVKATTSLSRVVVQLDYRLNFGRWHASPGLAIGRGLATVTLRDGDSDEKLELSESTVALHFGLKIGYDMGRNIDVQALLERRFGGFDFGDYGDLDGDATAFGLGIGYGFGGKGVRVR